MTMQARLPAELATASAPITSAAVRERYDGAPLDRDTAMAVWRDLYELDQADAFYGVGSEDRDRARRFLVGLYLRIPHAFRPARVFVLGESLEFAEAVMRQLKADPSWQWLAAPDRQLRSLRQALVVRLDGWPQWGERWREVQEALRVIRSPILLTCDLFRKA